MGAVEGLNLQIFVLALLAFALLYRVDSALRGVSRADADSLRGLLLRNAHGFLEPFTISVCAYAIMALVLRICLSPDTASVANLMQAERVAAELSGAIAVLRVPRYAPIAMLVALFVFSLLALGEGPLGDRLRAQAPRFAALARALSSVRRYNKAMSGLVSGTTVFAFVSLFGALPGAPETELNARIRHFADELGRVEQKIDARLRAEFVMTLSNRAFEAMPPSYVERIEAVRRSAASAMHSRNDPSFFLLGLGEGRSVPSVDAGKDWIEKAADAGAFRRSLESSALAARPPSERRARDAPERPGELQLSVRDTRNLELLLASGAAGTPGWLATLEAGRQLVRETMLLAIGAGDVIRADAAERVHPLLRPVAQTIARSLDDAARARVDALFERARAALLTGDLESFDRRVAELGARAAAAVPISAPDARVRAEIENAQREAKDLAVALDSAEKDLRKEIAARNREAEARREEMRRELGLERVERFGPAYRRYQPPRPRPIAR